MTRISNITTQRRWSPRVIAALALFAAFALGWSIASATAQPRRDDHRGDFHRDYHHDWHGDGGGYYPAPPPVVYGGPVYAAPPVAYGPAIGITLPGVSIGIQ